MAIGLDLVVAMGPGAVAGTGLVAVAIGLGLAPAADPRVVADVGLVVVGLGLAVHVGLPVTTGRAAVAVGSVQQLQA